MRMQPVSPPYAAEVQKLLDGLPASWAPPFLHFRILARDPRLLARYLRGAVSYLQPSHLTLRQREVFLLRVTGRCRCAFEWTLRAHYFAEEADLTAAQLRASVLGEAADPCWTGGEAVLVRLADELHDTSSISDRLWPELRSAVSEEAVLQLSLMAGHYRTNAYLTNGLELPTDPRVSWPFPEA
jgi:hypothetical protein